MISRLLHRRFDSLRQVLMELERRGVVLPDGLWTSDELQQFATTHALDAVLLRKFFTTCGFTPPYRFNNAAPRYRNRIRRF